MKILWAWLIALVLIGLAITFAPARAHETAQAEGIPDYVYLSGCCNKNDCRMIKAEAVQFTEEGYAFKLEQRPDDIYTVKEEESYDSSDGRYWGCFVIPTYCAHWGPEKEYNTMYGTSRSRSCIQYKDDTSKPWQLRERQGKKCFWKPVNA